MLTIPDRGLDNAFVRCLANESVCGTRQPVSTRYLKLMLALKDSFSHGRPFIFNMLTALFLIFQLLRHF